MPPKVPEKGIQSISSFFKPKTPSATAKSEVIILDSSSDEDERQDVSGSREPLPKRIKLEHGHNFSTAASTSSSTCLNTATINNTTSSSSSSHAPPTQTFKRLQSFSYDPQASTSKKVLTSFEQKRRDKFIEKLVLGGHGRRKKQSSYLQDEHFMAPTREEEEEEDEDYERGSDYSGGGMEEEADDDEEETDTFRGGRMKKDLKGKGKAKDQDETNSGSTASTSTTKFSKFLAKTSSSKTNTISTTTKIKYTPLEQQVIALKKANPGVLLAVEVGYKYKFFQEDAQVASKVLNIACFPQQHMLTGSIPTHRLDIHVRRLLNAGHKVGIVRQIETAALKKVSENKSKPFTRALTNLYTSATFVDELGVDNSSLGGGNNSATLMCLVEESIGKEKVRLGLIAVVPSTGEVVWDEFEDGLMRSELETRMLHLEPSELLLEKDLSPPTEQILKHLAGQVQGGGSQSTQTTRIERISKRLNVTKATSQITEFFAESKKRIKREMKKVPSEIILGDSDDDDDDERGLSASQKTDIVDTDESTSTISKVFDLPNLVLIALSSLITHLDSFNLSSIFLHTSSINSFSSRTTMTLNGNTITNLELLRNTTDFKETGSLIGVLDQCKTPMGKRLLRKWLSKPLTSIESVNNRLEAITEILDSTSTNLALSRIRELLKTLPDLERGLSRIHFGRASPNELLRVLEALNKIGTLFDDLKPPEEGGGGGGESSCSGDFGLKSQLLKDTVKELPKVRGIVKGLVDQVNGKMARDGRKEDLFVREQDWPELVECKKARDRVEEEIDNELKKARKILKKPTLQFKQVALEEYLLEVKISEKNLVPSDWLRINGTKTYYRFRSPSLQKKIQELEQSRERLAAAANAAYLSFLQEVASHYAAFRQTISSLSTIDCLFSLAVVALSNNYVRPTITSEAGRLEIKGGRHPIIEQVSREPFVENDVEFGDSIGRRQMILTGLNMGGKSSLARMIACIAVMAQIGSFVPAESCTTSLFDGIYTRMGASDSLMTNRSTFQLELYETSEILKLATRKSLIILDELGRGTSTNDGEAIASATLEFISYKKKSLCVFVTHYPGLASLTKKFPNSITVNHMACLESNSQEQEEGGGVESQQQQQQQQDITFLYKLASGRASSSHGINTAKLSGMPQSVLERAREKREELERIVKERIETRKREKFTKILRSLQQGLIISTRGKGEGEGEVEVEQVMEGGKLIELCRNVIDA